MPLDKIVQQDFTGGFWRSTARQLIDEKGCWDLQNFLLDDDGSLYRRGGSTYKSNAAFGSQLTFIWDGYLFPGQRTVFASPTAFGVLSGDDATPISLGGAGLANPTRAVVCGDLLFIGGGTIYGGSRKSASYSTGTVGVTNGTTAVTGTGTAFLANVDVGMLLQVGAGTRYYIVTAVNSDTSLTIKDPYEGSTNATAAYTLSPLGTANSPYRSSAMYAVVHNRLVSFESGNRIYFSAGRDPNSGQIRPHLFNPNDWHQLPEGSSILGGIGLRDTLLVFASSGLWQISNMAYNVVDAAGNPQHRLEHVTEEIVLLSQEGIAHWDNAVVVPAIDGAYRVDGISPPVPLALSIWKLIMQYARAGYKTGQGIVYRNHYLLPILNSSNALQDFLVCRLDRPQDTRLGRTFPWTRIVGQGAQIAGLDVRVTSATRTPALLGAGLTAAARVTDLSTFFEPAAAVKNDADGTTHAVLIETRDYPTNPKSFNLNHVRRLRARYELVDAASDGPTIIAYFSTGTTGGVVLTQWGSFNWGGANWSDATLAGFTQLAGQAGVSDGTIPYVWLFTKRTRFIRARLVSSGPAASLTLRSLEWFLRQSMRDR